MENFIQNLAGWFKGFGRGVIELFEQFVQARSIPEKYSVAHTVIVPLVVLFVLFLFWLDRYDNLKEKVLYTIYFIVGLEILVFIAVFFTLLA